MVTLDKIILGSNPFEGVGYLSRTQTAHYLEFFSKKENILPILDAAFKLGVRSFMCSNSDTLVAALKDFPHTKELILLPVIPNAYEYARESIDKGVLGTVLNKAKQIDLYHKVRFGLRALTKIQGILSKDTITLLSQLLDFEMACFHSYNVKAVLLHGQVTDLALSSNNPDIIRTYQNLIRERYSALPVLATHNFGTLVPRLIEWGINIPVMAPFNKKGFMMKPTQQECEDLLEKSGYYVIAKKVLAGGRLTPEEAFPYLAGKKVGSVVIGVGSLSEAYHTIAVAKASFQ